MALEALTGISTYQNDFLKLTDNYAVNPENFTQQCQLGVPPYADVSFMLIYHKINFYLAKNQFCRCHGAPKMRMKFQIIKNYIIF